jgi:hypothetical protein
MKKKNLKEKEKRPKNKKDAVEDSPYYEGDV